jgi:hypothetical protein
MTPITYDADGQTHYTTDHRGGVTSYAYDVCDPAWVAASIPRYNGTTP